MNATSACAARSPAAALAMWFGVSRKDLELSADDLALRNADRRDPNFGAQV